MIINFFIPFALPINSRFAPQIERLITVFNKHDVGSFKKVIHVEESSRFIISELSVDLGQ